jgi:hypothetical protein
MILASVLFEVIPSRVQNLIASEGNLTLRSFPIVW